MSQGARSQQLNLGDWVQRMSRGDQLIAGSSIVLLIFMFINAWQHASVDCQGNNPLCANAGQSGASGFNGWGWLTFFALLAVIAFFVSRNFLADSVKLPQLPIPDWQVYFGLGIIEVVGILLYWIEYRNSVSVAGLYTASVGFGWAWVVALIAAAVTVAGSYLKQQDPQPVSGSAGGYMPPSPGGYGAPPPPPPPPPSPGSYGAPPPPSAPPPGG